MNRILSLAAFVAGLLALVWIGMGYVGNHPLALAMTGLIAAFYIVGGLELQRFQQATAGLARALSTLPNELPQLDGWLASVPPALQVPVRLRIEGERVALPGPPMTPYLVGLLVLLGMLGTFLGMVVTLNGTVSALESTTDLASIRASLAAPVKGLGLAFGTSVAGVAASAMLGLASALCRRERLQASQLLDARMSTVLRGFSLVHQRQESLRTQQAQAQLMPQLVDRLQAMMLQMEQQSAALNERLMAGQDGFHRNAESAYTKLAASVDQSLKQSLAESARLAGTAIQPTLEAAMNGIARETTALQARVADAVQQQLDGVSQRFGSTVDTVAEAWRSALAQHAETSAALAARTDAALAGFAQTFEQRASALLTTVDKSQGESRAAAALQDEQRLQQWTQSLGVVADGLLREWQQAGAQHLAQQQQLATVAQSFEQRSAALLASVEQTQAESRAAAARQDEQRLHQWTQSLRAMADNLLREWQQAGAQHLGQQQHLATVAQRFEERSAALLEAVEKTQAESRAAAARQDEERLQRWAQSLETMAANLQREWQQAGEHQLGQQKQMANVAQSFEQRSAALLEAVEKTQAESRAAAVLQDEERLQRWAASLEAMAATLQREWQQAGANSLAQQQQIVETLDQAARNISTQAEAQARSTMDEVGRLMQAASEAPRFAAEVIGQLRQQLSDSIARDNTLLDERQRMMTALNEVLDAVHQASTDQRGAVDALVTSTAATLDRVSSQLGDKIAAEAGELSAAAAQITGSAVEVASLGEAFGFAVQLFSESNDKLMQQLQQIEATLGKSAARSDEQLAYYVAQAREIIELCVVSQKQIVDDLQQAATRQAQAAANTVTAGEAA